MTGKVQNSVREVDKRLTGRGGGKSDPRLGKVVNEDMSVSKLFFRE